MQSFLSKPHTLYFHEKNAAYGPVKLTYSALFLIFAVLMQHPTAYYYQGGNY